MIAEFSKWVPEGVTSPKAIVVLTPPSQSDGRGDVNSKVWQEFATKHGLALMGCYFQDDVPTGIEEYCHIGGRVEGDPCGPFVAAFEQYIAQNMYGGWYGPQALKMFFWGFSAGGQFNYEYACYQPKKVLGFVVNKGGIYYTHLAPKEARKVPGLFILGKRDAPWRVKSIEAIWGVNQIAGANWDIYAEDTSHSIGDSVRLGQEFFIKILKGMK